PCWGTGTATSAKARRPTRTGPAVPADTGAGNQAPLSQSSNQGLPSAPRPVPATTRRLAGGPGSKGPSCKTITRHGAGLLLGGGSILQAGKRPRGYPCIQRCPAAGARSFLGPVFPFGLLLEAGEPTSRFSPGRADLLPYQEARLGLALFDARLRPY